MNTDADLDLPSYAQIEKALLSFLAARGPIKPSAVYAPLADEFQLTGQQRKTQRPDNSTPIWNNHVQWARKSLKDKGYLSARLGIWELSDAGMTEAAKGSVPLAEAPMFPNEVAEIAFVIEGARRQVSVNAYERDSSARLICLAKWGHACSACEFNFERAYGEIGKGFIHVHHLTPLSSIREEYALVPERDLRPVCPNCHAMLHRRDPPLSIEQLREIIKLRGGD